jgi:hypothetical protein
MDQVVTHPLGVHLNQRHGEYLRDCGLGHSAMKVFSVNPVEGWWQSPWNPMREPEVEKPAQALGTAVHAFFLDGARAYNRLYGMAPTKATHPAYLDTQRELMDACLKHGLPTSGLKGELTDRLLRAKAKVKILQVERDKWNRKGKTPIAPNDDARIRMLHRMAMRSRTELNLTGEHLTLRQAFRGALTEVSVFWIDADGIRQRARFDFIKPNFTGDLKSITEWRASDFKQSLLREAVIRGYVLQWAHYDEARRQLRIACDEGRVFGGTEKQRRLLATIADADEWAWLWVYCKMEGAPQVRGIPVFREEEINGVMVPHPQYLKAVEQRQRALDNFLLYRETFGMDQMWFDLEVIWKPEDTDWPSWSDPN